MVPDGAPAKRLVTLAPKSERRRVTWPLWQEGQVTTVRLSTSFSKSVPHSGHRYS
jgi:hypothetical protein